MATEIGLGGAWVQARRAAPLTKIWWMAAEISLETISIWCFPISVSVLTESDKKRWSESIRARTVERLSSGTRGSPAVGGSRRASAEASGGLGDESEVAEIRRKSPGFDMLGRRESGGCGRVGRAEVKWREVIG